VRPRRITNISMVACCDERTELRRQRNPAPKRGIFILRCVSGGTPEYEGGGNNGRNFRSTTLKRGPVELIQYLPAPQRHPRA
jgi:hypothetical protein